MNNALVRSGVRPASPRSLFHFMRQAAGPATANATFGALTVAGHGGVSVAAAAIVAGDPGGHWQILNGQLAPSTAGEAATLSDGPYVLEFDTGTNMTVAIAPDTAHVAPEPGSAERAAAFAKLSSDTTAARHLRLRAGLYGDGATLFQISDLVMDGQVSHANLDCAALIADPSGYVYGDTGTIDGGAISVTAEGPVIWRDRTRFNRCSGIMFDGPILFRSEAASSPSVLISGSAQDVLGDFVFRNGVRFQGMPDDPVKGQGIRINGAGRVLIEDASFDELDNPVNLLGAAHLDMRRVSIWNYVNDAMSQRNETLTRMGDITCYVTLENVISTDRATGISHADNWQGSSLYNQLPIQHLVLDCVFGPYAQGFFIGDAGNSGPVTVTGVTGGSFASETDVTYGPSGAETPGRIRLVEDIGSGQIRLQITRGDTNALLKGDFTVPMPADGDIITDGTTTATVVGSYTKPLIYGGVIANTFIYSDFGQGLGLSNFEGLARNNTVVRFSGPDADNTAPNAFIDGSGSLIGPILTHNIATYTSANPGAMNNNVTIDSTIESGPESYASVFDLSNKTFSLGAAGRIVPSEERVRNAPTLLPDFMRETFATSAPAGANKSLDWTRPVLSNATTSGVETTVADGWLYWVIGASGSTPTGLMVVNGHIGWENGLPVAGSSAGSTDVMGSGTVTPPSAPVVPGGQSIYWCHVGSNGMDSAVVEAVANASTDILAPFGSLQSASDWNLIDNGWTIGGGTAVYDGSGSNNARFTRFGTTGVNSSAGQLQMQAWIDSTGGDPGFLSLSFFDGVATHQGNLWLPTAATGTWVDVGAPVTVAARTNGQPTVRVTNGGATITLSGVRFLQG